MNSKNVLWLDIAVDVPAFVLAAYLGANIAISLACAFTAASCLNVIGYSMRR